MSFSAPPLPPTQPDWTGFQVWWQQTQQALSDALQNIQDQVTDIQDALDAAAAAQASADAAAADAASAASDAATAQTTATTANTTANTVKRDDSISTSWTSPGSILTAADAGSNATITIAAHTRKYTDATSVSVNGGSITGRAYSTLYHVYYTQTSRAGGSVSYQSTTDPNVALPNAAAGRHYCGSVTTPAAGGGATAGGPNPPGGGGGGGTGFQQIP